MGTEAFLLDGEEILAGSEYLREYAKKSRRFDNLSNMINAYLINILDKFFEKSNSISFFTMLSLVSYPIH